MSDWIKCVDRLPTEMEDYDPTSTTDVLVVDDFGKVQVAFYSYESLSWGDFNGDEIDADEWGVITHWMPLPKPPTE